MKPFARICCAALTLLAAQTAAADVIALISDLNGRYGSTTYDRRVVRAIDTVVTLNPNLVVITGDMVAGQKQPRLDADHLNRMWAGFNNTVAEPLQGAGIPVAITPGNHDGSAFAGFELEREHYEQQWSKRRPDLEILEGSQWPRRYAAWLGDTLLITFDGTIPGKLPQSELDFVARILAAHASAAHATVVFSHLPLWPLASGREKEVLDDPELLALLHEYGVDVYASGHHHVYFAGTDEAGMVHLGVGALGGNARAFSGETSRQPHSFALLDIGPDSLLVQSRTAPYFDQGVDPAKLPAQLNGPLGVLLRLDGPAPLRD